MENIPLNDAIIIALSRLVDDAKTETRDPSHYDIQSITDFCKFFGSPMEV